jgi:adenosylmethionine-8-amino-7-oxononanoate aminotransferase
VRRTPGYDDPALADAALAALDAHHEQLAALVLEPLVQGAAGMQVTDPDSVRRVVAHAQGLGVLVVADEVATGFGRTGTLFASEQCGIRPDLLVIGKGITGGYLPLAATVASERVYQAILGPDLSELTFYHGHSYSGNALPPWPCATCSSSTSGTCSDNVNARAAQLGGLDERRPRPRVRATRPAS